MREAGRGSEGKGEKDREFNLMCNKKETDKVRLKLSIIIAQYMKLK